LAGIVVVSGIGALAGVVAVSGFSGLALVTLALGFAAGAGRGAGRALATGLAAIGWGSQAFSAASNRCQLSRITSGHTPLVM
jgi:hypothetical protein